MGKRKSDQTKSSPVTQFLEIREKEERDGEFSRQGTQEIETITLEALKKETKAEKSKDKDDG